MFRKESDELLTELLKADEAKLKELQAEKKDADEAYEAASKARGTLWQQINNLETQIDDRKAELDPAYAEERKKRRAAIPKTGCVVLV